MCQAKALTVICVMNSVLLAMGLSILTVGCLLLYKLEAILPISENIKDLADDEELIKEAMMRLPPVATTSGAVIFNFGLVMVSFAVLSYIGFFWWFENFLVLYGSLMVLLMAGHLAIVIALCAATPSLYQSAGRAVQSYVRYYKSLASRDLDSIALAIVMQSFKCCGDNGAIDFRESYIFLREDEFKGVVYTDLDYSIACCDPKHLGTGKGQCRGRYHDPYMYGEGCTHKLARWMHDIVAGSAVGLFIELMNAISAFVFAWKEHKIRDEVDEDIPIEVMLTAIQQSNAAGRLNR